MPEVLFVGREREKDLYSKFLVKETPWVLIIIGLGGIGKTTLLHRLAMYTEAEFASFRTHAVTLDFADEELRNDPLKILDELTKETASYCNLQQIDEQFKNELQRNIEHLTQLSRQRLQSGVNETDDLALREIRHQMRELATEAFYAQIKTCTLDHLVIMLDTCEWLNEPEGAEVGQWVMNELIPGIHTRIRQTSRRCSVVIASRVLPKLDVINGREQRRITLPMLGKAEVDTYLVQMGMQDASLRQRVYDVTHGHALCVSIIGDFWQNRDEQTQSLTSADLPELQLEEFSEIALMRFTNERVLKQLKSPFKELTRYGVLLRSFDLPLLRNVFPDLLPESGAFERFNQLTRYPYIEPRGNYRYAFHELLREALAEEVQKEDAKNWRGYHKRAFDYITQVSPHSLDWYYHLLAYDEQQGLMEWQQAIQEARKSGRREFVGALLQAALDKTLKLSLSTCAEIQYEQGRFNFRNVQWEEALHNYQDALTSFQQIDDFAGQAKVLQAIGDVQRVLIKYGAAFTSYEQALAIFRQVKNLSGQARVLQAIGDVQQLCKEPEAALQSYEQALVLFRQIGDQSEEARVLETLGDIQRTREKYDVALRYYQQALTLYQEEKDRSRRARLLKIVGYVQWLFEDKYAALESFGQALALYGELKEPAEEARVRQSMEDLQNPIGEPSILIWNDKQNEEKTIVVSLPRLSASLTQSPSESDKWETVLISSLGQTVLGTDIVTIGRGSENDLVIKDPQISRCHAEIRPEGQGYGIIDLTSGNGTFLNGQRLAPNVLHKLQIGDRLQLADTIFIYTYKTIPESEAVKLFQLSYTSAPHQLDVAPPTDEPVTMQLSYPSTPYLPYSSPAHVASPPIPVQQPHQRGSFRGLVLLPITLALLLIVGSSFLYYVSVQHSAQLTPAVLNALTAQAHGTQQENLQTIQTANAISTAIYNKFQAIYIHNTTGDPTKSDTLSTQDNLHWDEYSNCIFRGGAYHSFANANALTPCFAKNTNLINFTFQVQMTIINGFEGGIIFRADNLKSNFYYFRIDETKNYFLFVNAASSTSFTKALIEGHSKSIKIGPNQFNLIAVVAMNTGLYFYINGQFTDNITDDIYKSGQIGVAAEGLAKSSAEVAFSNVQIWKL